MRGSRTSTAKLSSRVLCMPAGRGSHARPPSVLTYTPALVAAYMRPGTSGSNASARTDFSRLVESPPIALQVAPALVLTKTPPPRVPA